MDDDRRTPDCPAERENVHVRRNRNGPTLSPPTPRPPGAPLALAGIRVADFSHFIAGPLCSMILADLGAEVIKIEKADGGDDFRRIRPPVTEHEGAPYLWANRNKKSIALDLTQPEARRIAREIVDRSDVVLENFSTGVMAKFGLDYATVAAANPRLIYASVSAYGRDGALRDRLGFDPITQAEFGLHVDERRTRSRRPARRPVHHGHEHGDDDLQRGARRAVRAGASGLRAVHRSRRCSIPR